MAVIQIPVEGAPRAAAAGPSKDRLADTWYRSVYTSNVAYAKAEESAHKWGRALGLMVVAFSTITGTALFTTLQNSPSPTARAVVGGLAAASAVIAAVNTYFGFGALEIKYHKASVDYGGLKAELYEKLELPGPLPVEWLDDFRKRWLQAFENSPTLPTGAWRQGDSYVREHLGEPRCQRTE